MSYLDRDPGIYDNDGPANALVEQQRANMLRVIRETKAVSVTAYEENGDGIHWAIYLDDGDAAETFILYAAVKAVRDVAAGLGMSPQGACALVLKSIAEGVGE